MRPLVLARRGDKRNDKCPRGRRCRGLDGAATYHSVPVPLLVRTFILTATLANVFSRLVLTLLLRMAHLAVTITVSPVGVGPAALRAFNLLGHGMRTSPHHVLYVIVSGAPLDVRQRVVELRVLEWCEVTAFLTRRAGSDERAPAASSRGRADRILRSLGSSRARPSSRPRAPSQR